MSNQEPAELRELEKDDRLRTRRERTLTGAIFTIGIVLSLVIGYELTATDEGIRSIKCQDGDVTLIIERADGDFERVACPADVELTP